MTEHVRCALRREGRFLAIASAIGAAVLLLLGVLL